MCSLLHLRPGPTPVPISSTREARRGDQRTPPRSSLTESSAAVCCRSRRDVTVVRAFGFLRGPGVCQDLAMVEVGPGTVKPFYDIIFNE